MGDLAADAVREACGSQLALVNAGVIRGGFDQGGVTLGSILAASPFDDAVVVQTVTGAQLWAAVENGLGRLPEASGRFPQISGFSSTYDAAAPEGDRVRSLTLEDGREVRADANRYELAVTEFNADGGDGYTVLVTPDRRPCDAFTRILVEHVRTHSPLVPAAADRIRPL